MPATEAPAYSSPFILDLGMPDNAEDLDEYNFFESSMPIDAGSPATFLTEDLQLGDDPAGLASPGGVPQKEAASSLPSLQSRSQVLSVQSSASPAESFRDSSSDSSVYIRKSSSDSSRSPLEGKHDVLMTDRGTWPGKELTSGAGTPFGIERTVNSDFMNDALDFNDKSMEDDFDFESAASSPSRFGALNIESPKMPTVNGEKRHENASKRKSRIPRHAEPSASQHFITQPVPSLTTTSSREASPLSAVVASHETSPSTLFNNASSPSTGVGFVSGPMLDGPSPQHQWSTGYDYGMGVSHIGNGLHSQPVMSHVPSPPSSGHLPADYGYRPTLSIHPTPLKSRVETQIPIKMSLFPVPPGITKLHLQAHTISKPKLLANPAPERSPDTLELYTMLVCTSAMQNPEYRRRAFARAGAKAQTPCGSPANAVDGALHDDDDENKPLNGGEVKICSGCITRERKRAARKKVKKVDEEESWHKDEHKRVIVFNTQEIKDWQPPTNQIPSDAMGDRAEPVVHEGAMQVDAPMRIACYCRHQHEKLGFQVIFTIKDCDDRLVAQAISSSIMITDDHKTHTMPSQNPNCSDAQLFPGAAIFSSENGSGGFEMSIAPFRTSQSSSDLQGLQQGFSVSFPAPMNVPVSLGPSQVTSTTMTPRVLSRQGSPTTQNGPTSKKRKASGSNKVPSGLAMTRLETVQSPNGPSSCAPAGTAPSAPTPNAGSLQAPEAQFSLPSSISPGASCYNAGPLTPNSNDQVLFSGPNRSQSMDNIALNQLYSAPTSAHPSRPPSPNGLRNSVQNYQQQQAQIAQAVANGFYGLPLTVNPHRPPTIHKMIPSEGPKAGGIEVTCLGSGFFQGLEVMFGDTKATTTTYWGETSLVCLLPPASYAGTVAVTFKHQHQHQQAQAYPTPPIPKQQILFKYVDDDEQQIIRLALSVLGHKMNGKIEDVRDLARRIVGSDVSASSWGAPMGPSPPAGGQHQQGSSFNAATFGVDVEATLLRCLDLVDLDDSHHMPRLNLRRQTGQTMLHLACSLGLHRFVAALLARGANPEPRDKGGFTPMHFAAMHDHPQIVRRLILSGADPTMRSLQGYTPADLAISEEVLQSTRRFQHHKRTRSTGSIRSRTSSVTSLRSLWEPPSGTPAGPVQFPTEHSSEDDDSFNDDEDESMGEDIDLTAENGFGMTTKRLSISHVQAPEVIVATQSSLLEPSRIHEPVSGHASPSAAMTAFRDQLTAQIAHLQHSMHLNLPNLPQLPTLPLIPNLPDYQAYLPTAPMVRRISSMVPSMGSSRQSPVDDSKEADYKWWDLFSGSIPAAPPAYDEIFPQRNDDTHDMDKDSATQSAADTFTDDKCAAMCDHREATSSSVGGKVALLNTVRIGQKHTITREQQDQLRQAHAEKVKRFRSDRNLFFIWIPLLVVIVLPMLYNRAPKVWSEVGDFVSAFRVQYRGRTFEA
ncbi:MAG: hypothetical protein M1818_004006 [Claussenomyces sp. TS43310]|nr:MAG: hypothetical protein M1818_004006 [Claussenomyces sp. TS43310]